MVHYDYDDDDDDDDVVDDDDGADDVVEDDEMQEDAVEDDDVAEDEDEDDNAEDEVEEDKVEVDDVEKEGDHDHQISSASSRSRSLFSVVPLIYAILIFQHQWAMGLSETFDLQIHWSSKSGSMVPRRNAFVPSSESYVVLVFSQPPSRATRNELSY